MNLNMRVASNIKHLRESKQLKQSVVAKALNMSETNLSRLENGKIGITLCLLEKVAAVLEVAVWDLLNPGATEETIVVKKVDMLLKLFETSVHRGYTDQEMIYQNEKIIRQQQSIIQLLNDNPNFAKLIKHLGILSGYVTGKAEQA